MLPVIVDLIEYLGVSELRPSDFVNYKQFNVSEEFILDDFSPDIAEVVKVFSDVVVEKTKVVKTPVGTSLEGVALTGYKVFVYGTINHRIQYMACNSINTNYSINFSSPFITQIVVPERLCESGCITTSVFIDDIYIKKLNNRLLYNNTSLFVALEL